VVSPSSLGDDSVHLLGSIRWQPDLINAAPQKLEQEHCTISTHNGNRVLSVRQHAHRGKVVCDDLQVLQSAGVASGEGGGAGSETATFPEVGLDTKTVQEQTNVKPEEVEESVMERLAGRALHLLVPELLPLSQLQIAIAQEDLVVYVRLE